MNSGPQSPTFLARKAEDFVDDDASNVLLATLAGDTGFLRVKAKAFILNDLFGQNIELGNLHLVAGEGEIVGVAGVGKAEGAGQSGEAVVEGLDNRVAQAGTGGRALDAVTRPDGDVEGLVTG